MKSASGEKTVLFINPPLYFDSRLQPQSLDVSLPHLGLLYLATYINHHSQIFRAKIIDIGAQNLNLEQTINKIKKTNPLAICLTAMTPQLQGLYTLATAIRQTGPQTVILGGPHISGDPDFINRHPRLFDYAITGEAETTLLQSLNKLHLHQKIPLIQSGKAVRNLNRLPIPNRHLINRRLYQPAESILFSRGCPFHCYYCSRPAISRLVRYRSTSNLISEIKQTYQYHHSLIDFQDDTFTLRHPPIINLCQTIIRQKIKLSWACNTRVDMVDKKLLTLMKKAGCRQINFGIESASLQLRHQIIKKGNFTNRQIQQTFQTCRSLKIKVAAYFMIGHPTETKKNLQATRKMIMTYPIDILGLSIPLPFPGAPLYKIAEKQGIISSQIIDNFACGKIGLGYSDIYPQFHTPALSPDYLHRQMTQINRRFYLRPRTVFSNFKSIMSSPKKSLNDLTSLIKYGMSSRKPYKK